MVKMWTAEGNLCVQTMRDSTWQAARCVGADLSLESGGKARKMRVLRFEEIGELQI